MIYCLDGTPGVGKSLFLVSKIIPDYLKIRTPNGCYCPVHIWTNIEGLKPSLLCALAGLPESITMYIHQIGESIDEEGKTFIDKRYLQYFYYDPQTIEWVSDYDPKNKSTYEHPDYSKVKYLPWNSLIILDEIQNVFGSRDFDKQFTRDALPYITRHRHYGHNIFWASQNHEQVEISFRRNTEQVWFLEKLEHATLNFFKGAGEFKVSMYEGKFAGYLVNVDPFATEKVKKDERYYKAYKSHVSEEVVEKSHTKNMWLNSKPIKIVAGIMAVLVVLIIVNGNPLKKLTIGAQTRDDAKKASSQATHQPTKGLVPVGGVERSEKEIFPENDTLQLCYTKMFINRGRLFYVLNNGQTKQVKKAGDYEECK